MERRYKLNLIGITYNQIESGVYAVILEQEGAKRRIPIIIGYPEAQAIECKLQEVTVPRPLTHDMMVNMMATFGITLTEVEIRKLPNGVFAADLHLLHEGERRVVDSRSSDAIALAIRVGAPIYTSESVLREAGFEPDGKSSRKREEIESRDQFYTSVADESGEFEGYSIERLEEEMLKAADQDDYETAARIKAEIDRRKNG